MDAYERLENQRIEIDRLRATVREVELLLWKSLVDEGGSATIPYVEDLPDRGVRLIRHEHYVECVAMGSSADTGA